MEKSPCNEINIEEESKDTEATPNGTKSSYSNSMSKPNSFTDSSMSINSGKCSVSQFPVQKPKRGSQLPI